MPERSSLTQGVQIGVEVTPGTPVAANRYLSSIGFEPGIQISANTFRAAGTKLPSIVVPGKEWVEAGISGAASYTELIYLLASVLKTPTPVQQGATTAYLWEFIPAMRAEDVVKTFTIEQGGVVRAHKFSYALVTELGMTFTRESIELAGSMLGQSLTDAAVLTAAPTAIALKPILPADVSIYLDPTSGALGTTKLTRALKASPKIGDRFEPVWPLDAALDSYAAHVESEPSAELTLLVEADAQGMGLLSTLRAGSTAFIRIEAVAAELAGTAFPYKFTMDMACKVNGVAPFSDEDGVYAIEWTFQIVSEPTWASGQALRVAVVNAIAAL